MDASLIEKLLAEHLKWWQGKGGARADLTGADLRRANLSGANLSGADLADADLTGADLRGADLSGADLTGADLTGADLTGADLRSADLTGADLRSADLTGADLRSANLHGADLHGADLRGANLHGADLRGANLGPRSIVPEVGPFHGFKKLKGGIICEVLIPAEAARTSSFVGRKCRAEFVRVISGAGTSERSGAYVVGKITRPDAWDADPRVECSHGIHFFLTRQEAEEY